MKRTLLFTAIAVGWASVGSAAEFVGVGAEGSHRVFWTSSANGEVIAGRYNAGGEQGAFRWTAETGAVRLASPPDAGDLYLGGLLSGDGKVYLASFRDNANHLSSYRWTEDAGFVPYDSASVTLFALSMDGAHGVGFTNDTPDRAALWNWGSGTEAIDTRAPALGRSRAYSMTPDRSAVVGWMRDSSDPDAAQAFRWTQEQGMVGLGDLPGGRFFSNASSISADGRVVVGAGITAASELNAFRWTEETGLVPLETAVNDIVISGAYDVSGDGSLIVGAFDLENGPQLAFIWDEAHGMRLLKDVLVDDYGLGPQLAGWTLSIAHQISDDGRTIIGSGTNPDGQADIWVARIPEPSALVLALVGVFTVVVARRAVHPLPHRTRA